MAWLLRGREGATEETGAWSLGFIIACAQGGKGRKQGSIGLDASVDQETRPRWSSRGDEKDGDGGCSQFS